MIKKFCAAHPCPNLVGKGERFCPEHQQQETVAAGKKITDPFYSTARWQRFRKWYRAQHPLCEKCGGVGHLVDHIKEIKDGGALLDENNVQTLCRKCHAGKTMAERQKRGELKVYGY